MVGVRSSSKKNRDASFFFLKEQRKESQELAHQKRMASLSANRNTPISLLSRMSARRNRFLGSIHYRNSQVRNFVELTLTAARTFFPFLFQICKKKEFKKQLQGPAIVAVAELSSVDESTSEGWLQFHTVPNNAKRLFFIIFRIHNWRTSPCRIALQKYRRISQILLWNTRFINFHTFCHLSAFITSNSYDPGLEINPERPDSKLPYKGAWLWVGKEMIHLMELPNPDPTSGRPEHGGRDRHACFTVGNVIALGKRLDEAGKC